MLQLIPDGRCHVALDRIVFSPALAGSQEITEHAKDVQAKNCNFLHRSSLHISWFNASKQGNFHRPINKIAESMVFVKTAEAWPAIFFAF